MIARNASCDLASWNTRQILETIFRDALGTVECVMGIVTNIINCTVFWRQGLASRMNLCLFSLALADCCYFITIVVAFALPVLLRLFLYEDYSYKVIIAAFGVGRGFALTSGCMNMVVAVDTCVGVVLPHRAVSIMRTRTMMSLIVSCFFLMQACYLVFSCSYTISRMVIGECAQLSFALTKVSETNQRFVYFFVSMILETAIPLFNLAVVCVATIVTVRRLQSALTWRENTSYITNSCRHKQLALTKMLVVVAVVYVVITLPCAVSQVTLAFIIDRLADSIVLNNFAAISTAIYNFSHINKCFNIFVYYYRSTRFRRELLFMFGLVTSRSGRRLELGEK